MRIAAGIFLIVFAIINGIAGNGYRVAAAFVDARGELATELRASAEKPVEGVPPLTGEGTPEAAATAAEARTQANLEKAIGAGLDQAAAEGASSRTYTLLAYFVFLVAALQLAGAITLFSRKAAPFVMAVAVFGIAAEVWGGVVSGFGLLNILGLGASALALLAARGLSREPVVQSRAVVVA